MSYPFLQGIDYGPRDGTLGIGIHMSEGYDGLAYYLSQHPGETKAEWRNRVNGVSCTVAIDSKGKVVQMLKWTSAHGNLNPHDRAGEYGYYGHSNLVDVLGDHWPDPNMWSVSAELAGFRKDGPTRPQIEATVQWGLEMAAMFPAIRGTYGHHDQSTKPCPGTTPGMKEIFARLGGHGLWRPDIVNLSPKHYLRGVKVEGGRGIFREARADSDLLIRNTVAGEILPLDGNVPGWQVVDPDAAGGIAGYVANDAVDEFVDTPLPPAPPADCSAEIEAATKPLKAEIVLKNTQLTDYNSRLGKINLLSDV